jgi:hypothetical protein
MEPMDSAAEEQEDSQRRMVRLACIPGHSAASIVEVRLEASPPVDGRALVVVFMGAEAPTAVATGDYSIYKGKFMTRRIEIMRTTNLKATRIFKQRLCWAAGLTFTLLVIGHPGLSLAQTSQTQTSQPQAPQAMTFSSPGEAVAALFQATQNRDEQALEAILGAGKDVTSSSDEVEDKLEREQFSKKYQEMHRLVREPDGSTVLYIGAENWPFPISLVSKDGQWYFDCDKGTQEILARRIGQNETTAIQVCEEFAMAKNQDTLTADSEDPITRFAQNLVSAGAANTSNNDSSPFHGYYFRVVRPNTVAGPNDPKKVRDLTLIAYPADYRESGVMTFVVTHHGTMHQKDLGPKTATVAPRIKSGTGPSWQPLA